MSSLRSLVTVMALALGAAVVGSEGEASAGVSSLSSSAVTLYGAKWCSACSALQRALTDRKIAFDVVDVDQNPQAFARAREASGAGNAIPLTSIVRTSNTVWVVGADVDAVDRAQRGD